MMVLTLKEIKIVMTMMMVAAITFQVPTVHEEFEESFWKTETSDLGHEQYTGVCQTPQALGDNRSAQSLHQTPTFLPCLIPAWSWVMQHRYKWSCDLGLPIIWNKRNRVGTPSVLREGEVAPIFLPSGVYYVLWLLMCVLSHNSLPHLLRLVPYYVLLE